MIFAIFIPAFSNHGFIFDTELTPYTSYILRYHAFFPSSLESLIFFVIFNGHYMYPKHCYNDKDYEIAPSTCVWAIGKQKISC